MDIPAQIAITFKNHMKNWKQYLSELIMLFAAVSAGFWVDNYRDEQSEREVLKRKLEAFVYEYEVVTKMLDSIDFHSDYLLPTEFAAYELLLKGNGSREEMIRALIEAYNIVILPSDGLDDLIKFSSIMGRDEARFLTNETVINGLLRLNDGLNSLRNAEQRKTDIDTRIIQLFAKHRMVTDMNHYNEIYPSFFSDLMPSRDTSNYQPKMIYGFGLKTKDYEPFGDLEALLADEQLKVIIQEKYVLYTDDQTERDRIIQTLHSIVPSIREEIARL